MALANGSADQGVGSGGKRKAGRNENHVYAPCDGGYSRSRLSHLFYQHKKYEPHAERKESLYHRGRGYL